MQHSKDYQATFFDGQTASRQVLVVRFLTHGIEHQPSQNLWAWPDVEVFFESTTFARLTHKSTRAVLEFDDYSAVADLKLMSQQGIRVGATGFTVDLKRGTAFFFGAMVLLAAFAFLLANPATQWLAMRVPLNTEIQLASKIDLSQTLGPICVDPPAQAALDQIIQKLVSSAPKTIHPNVSIVKSQIENAFTLPGNRVLITSGLLHSAQNAAEVAGVLAHELGHAAHRHVLASILRATLLTSVWSLALGDFSGIAVIDPSTAVNLASLSFSRREESQADDYALEMMVKNNISPLGLINFLDRNKTQSAKIFKLMSTHPGSDERARKLSKAASAYPLANDQHLNLDEPQWLAIQSACVNK